ncbi:glycosyltransferase family 2 protein [Plicaturopsis crispa FD-325 SS-3]|nr:glycosyltransferase family 2 protein [Plicaturopsis crispa FD-325 SS-3]
MEEEEIDLHGESFGNIPPSHDKSADYQPYQPGQYLPTILTGETLQLDEYTQPPPPPPDPFSDSQQYVAEKGYTYYEQQPYDPPLPPLPQSYDPHQPLYDPQHAYDPQQPYDHNQSFEDGYRPQSTHSYQGLDADEPVYNGAGLPLPAGAADHFHHDAEAYASGNYSRASFRPPRSRSPTPAVDDEDYHIVGDTSVHYTGHDPTLQDIDENYGYGYDLEKAPYTGYNEKDPYALQEDESKTPSTSDFPITPLETRHFGSAPAGRVLRRHKTKKRVPLTHGNLVVDLPVPPKLVLPLSGRAGEDGEMTRTRYTAVTCDPDHFERRGFGLRQNLNGRKTELFIVITMYNEDEVLFCRTMYGVMRNIAHLCERKNSQTWGPEAWKKARTFLALCASLLTPVVVCIVADGRKRINPRVLDCLTLLGVYQPGDHMKNMVNNKKVTAHLFEYTTSFGLDANLHFRYPDKKGMVPTQILFCMKEKNERKINSHRWFFNAFAPLLQPNVCVLLDVGTRPGNNSIYRLWKTFDVNSSVGGACGEIAAYKGKRWSALLNPLVAAQNFEYKMSSILDKTTESMFGYISVLPGAFSAYRYIALQNDKKGVGPLNSYFKGEVLHGRDTDIFTSNMYLAEDRILCFELIAKSNSSWVLKYVKGAIGETDVPDSLPEFISQRRRWLNGSFFAATYAIAHVGQILRSGHSLGRKVVLMCETVYNIINLVFNWFSLGNFYLFFVVLTSSLEAPVFKITGIKYVNSMIQYFMACMIIACFLFSMGNKPQASRWKYKLTSIMLAVAMLYLIVCSALVAIQAAAQGGAAYNVMLLSLTITYGVYLFSSILAFDPWHMITSFIPYILMSPTYINILNIYAFSNLDDISWGTKQDSVVETDLGVVIQDKHSQVDVEMLAEAADVNGLYEEALGNLRNRKVAAAPRAKSVPSPAEKEQAAKDYYANVRTNVLLAWVLSNGLLLVGILGGGASTSTLSGDGGEGRTKSYMMFILAFSAITNTIRFLGSTMYLLTRLITG